MMNGYTMQFSLLSESSQFTSEMQVKLFLLCASLLFLDHVNSSAANCISGNYYTHENDCNKFYICEEGQKLALKCLTGFYWNQPLQRCTPKISQYSYGIAVISDTESGVCQDKYAAHDYLLQPIYLPYPNDCTHYVKCLQGRTIVMECPCDWQWNAAENRCDTADRVQCQADADIDFDISIEAFGESGELLDENTSASFENLDYTATALSTKAFEMVNAEITTTATRSTTKKYSNVSKNIEDSTHMFKTTTIRTETTRKATDTPATRKLIAPEPHTESATLTMAPTLITQAQYTATPSNPINIKVTLKNTLSVMYLEAQDAIKTQIPSIALETNTSYNSDVNLISTIPKEESESLKVKTPAVNMAFTINAANLRVDETTTIPSQLDETTKNLKQPKSTSGTSPYSTNFAGNIEGSITKTFKLNIDSELRTTSMEDSDIDDVTLPSHFAESTIYSVSFGPTIAASKNNSSRINYNTHPQTKEMENTEINSMNTEKVTPSFKPKPLVASIFSTMLTREHLGLPFRAPQCIGDNNRVKFAAARCHQFYQCFEGYAYVLNCYDGYAFDKVYAKCILAANVDCKDT